MEGVPGTIMSYHVKKDYEKERRASILAKRREFYENRQRYVAEREKYKTEGGGGDGGGDGDGDEDQYEVLWDSFRGVETDDMQEDCHGDTGGVVDECNDCGVAEDGSDGGDGGDGGDGVDGGGVDGVDGVDGGGVDGVDGVDGGGVDDDSGGGEGNGCESCDSGGRGHDISQGGKGVGGSGTPPEGNPEEEKRSWKRVISLLDSCGIVIGMHPDQAAGAIVDFAISKGIPFALTPCCVYSDQFPHRRLKNGEKVTTYSHLIRWLVEKDPSHIKLDQLDFEGKNVVVYSNPRIEKSPEKKLKSENDG
eukprot:TRINITY_DN1374_c0_g4_i1.p1 TRINITY_DN1374_c0_g4~~TRINITY_DN1374_c0_g4_i1.p1  ORF type:complete len:306 (-),score=133.03 TRINITY_DN1374_c0_g4_i1:341-1258(-)